MERKKYIQKCYDEYIESTNIETKTIDFSDDVAYRTVSNNLDSFIENSFICFSKSILCGEYIYSDTFNNDITIFLNAISREYSIDDDEKKAIINNRIQEINKSLFNSIRHLQRVQIYAKQKVDTKDNSNDFGIYSTYTSTTPSRLDDFINLCIPICKFDYQFPSNDDKFQDLRFVGYGRNHRLHAFRRNPLPRERGQFTLPHSQPSPDDRSRIH